MWTQKKPGLTRPYKTPTSTPFPVMHCFTRETHYPTALAPVGFKWIFKEISPAMSSLTTVAKPARQSSSADPKNYGVCQFWAHFIHLNKCCTKRPDRRSTPRQTDTCHRACPWLARGFTKYEHWDRQPLRAERFLSARRYPKMVHRLSHQLSGEVPRHATQTRYRLQPPVGSMAGLFRQVAVCRSATNPKHSSEFPHWFPSDCQPAKLLLTVRAKLCRLRRWQLPYAARFT